MENKNEKITSLIYNWIKNMFSLAEGRISEEEILKNFSNNYEFRGAKLWVLILAMLIASVGLNVNSTAVIIGAMLISPLMDPIIAIGVGISANNFILVRNSLYQLGMAVLFSIITSCVYFMLSPIKTAQSELLARTEPAIWDVFIAFFGGLAGIIGATRADKGGNILPGVAIATALMPPLCTAGYGLATGQWNYMFGAMYLFTINGVFIVCSTVVITSFMRFSKAQTQEKTGKRKAMRTILIAAGLTLIPSVYLATKLVQRSQFETQASNFIENEINYDGTAIVNQKIIYDNDPPKIELFLLGKPISKKDIKNLNAKLEKYNLEDVKLIIHQGESQIQKAQDNTSYSEIADKMYFTYKEEIEKLKTENKSLKKNLNAYEERNYDSNQLLKESSSIFPDIKSFSVSYAIMSDSIDKKDTVLITYIKNSKALKADEKEKFSNWIKSRLNTNLSIKLLEETEK